VCRHRVHGVGMFDVASVLAGDAVVAAAGQAGKPVDVLVGTVSACHGAASLLHLGTDPSLNSFTSMPTSAAGAGRGTPGCSYI
jgi:TRAP-type mannitol/chloroaromatic compound transport system substrate-binding protein